MGYYTRHRLTAIDGDGDAIHSKVTALHNGFDPFDDPCKWYESDDHMRTATSAIPGVFILDGEGEDAGDVWRKVFSAGAIVWEWRADAKPPEPPREVIAPYLTEAAVAREAARVARIAELRAELRALEGDEGDGRDGAA